MNLLREAAKKKFFLMAGPLTLELNGHLNIGKNALKNHRPLKGEGGINPPNH